MFLLQPALAEDTAPWKIAIIGDTHDSPKRMEGSEGVAVNFIKTLYGEILKHNVDMVVQVGDMADIEGSAPVKGLAKRKELNNILREKGIPFYAVRGNHDSLPFRAEQFRELFLPTRRQGVQGLATRKLNYGIRHKNASLYFMDIDLTPDQLVDFSAWVKPFRDTAWFSPTAPCRRPCNSGNACGAVTMTARRNSKISFTAISGMPECASSSPGTCTPMTCI